MMSSSVPRNTGIRLYPLWAKTIRISSSAACSSMATMSVRGVMTSRTGRTLNAMTPPTRNSSSSARRPTAAPSRQMERRSVGRVAVRVGSSRPITRDQGRSTGMTRSATDSALGWVSQRGTR